MKKIINVAELKQKIDYESLGREIVAESLNGRLTRQNPYAAALEPVKEALITARQNNSSYRSLAEHLSKRGIPISTASMRRYLLQQMDGGKPPKRQRAPKPAKQPDKPEPPTLFSPRQT